MMSISSIPSYSASLNHLSSTINKVDKTQASDQAQTVNPDQQRSYGNASTSQASKISLSADALFTLSKVNQNTSVVPSQYEQFFPAREGYPVKNLVAGIEDPSAQPFSRNKPFVEVAGAARQSLDIKFQKMDESGHSFDSSSFEGVDHSSLFGELDRRALHAVASNEGGLFSEKEQSTAKMFMGQQQGLASGLYHGPHRLRGEYSHPGMQEFALKPISSIEFMNQVSNEEKSTVNWAFSQALSQWSYEMEMSKRGEVAQDLTSENPLVQLIKAALDTWPDRPGVMGGGKVENKYDLLGQPWFDGFEDRLEDAIAQANELYGVS